MDETTITPPAILRALRHLETLKAEVPPGNSDLADLANAVQREVLSVVFRGISDAERRAMMLESAGVMEDEDGSMSVSEIFEQTLPHLVAVKAVANALRWMDNKGFIIVFDPTINEG